MSGPTHPDDPIATLANAITASRLVLSVPWVVLVTDQGAGWLTFGLGFVLAISDLLDGWLARRQGTTSSGAFLDPLADKVLVLGGLWALVAQERFTLVPVVLITVRELAISVWRSYLARRGISVPARFWAKRKTFVQQLAVGFALLPVLEDTPAVADVTLWVAVALTVWTGLDYLRDGGRLVRERGREDAREV